MAQLRFRKPTALAGPGLSDFVANYMRPNSQACRLNGTGTFSWLLEIDLAAGKLRTGGAPPSGPYCFLERSFSVGEATFQTNSIELGLVTQGDRIQTVGGTNELVLAMYADETNGVVLPLRDVSIEARLSPDQNCVGRYNAEGLDPKKGCVPDLSTPQFFPDGTVRTHIELELAEKVPVPPLNQTLCMVLARDVPAYGNGEVPIGCKRDETGKIAFRGDWCSASNSPATDTCADAVAVEADFAASAVPVAGECP